MLPNTVTMRFRKLPKPPIKYRRVFSFAETFARDKLKDMYFAVLTYLFSTILRSIGRFFAHWYTKGSALFWHTVLDFFGELEGMVSLRITAFNWYKPLYGDYTRLGMALGIPIRISRVFLSAILYALLFSFFALVYALYIALPVFLLSRLV